MAQICRRCKRYNMGKCLNTGTDTYKITDQEIKDNLYGCFKERLFKGISSFAYDLNGEDDPYESDEEYLEYWKNISQEDMFQWQESHFRRDI
jgi:hypothetical protein